MFGRERASWKRILGAVALGHVAAAFSFSVSAMIGMAVFDPALPATSASKLVTDFAKIALGLPLLVSLVMLPPSLLTSPFTIFAALKIRAGAGTALTVGAAIGAAWVIGFEVTSCDWPGTWSRAGLPGDPRTLALIVGDGAIAGIAYAWVVWSRCICPLRKHGENGGLLLK